MILAYLNLSHSPCISILLSRPVTKVSGVIFMVCSVIAETICFVYMCTFGTLVSMASFTESQRPSDSPLNILRDRICIYRSERVLSSLYLCKLSYKFGTWYIASHLVLLRFRLAGCSRVLVYISKLTLSLFAVA